MTEWEAIRKRISCRSYADRMLDEETIQKLRDYIDELNAESGLHFQFFVSSQPGKQAIKLFTTMFSGPVYAFAALVGGEDPESSEKLGYYGEKLVLYATQLGLGTCWVGGTYDRKSISPAVPDGYKLWDVVPIGYATEKVPVKQKMIRTTVRRTDRKLEKFLESEVPYAEAPEWIRKGIEAIFLGPSAVNQQPVNIVYRDGKVYARLWKKCQGLEYNDLGIAKRHFEIGAEEAGVKGHFLPGSGGEFVIG